MSSSLVLSTCFPNKYDVGFPDFERSSMKRTLSTTSIPPLNCPRYEHFNCLLIRLFTGDWKKSAIRGPIEVAMGLGAGVLCGLVIGYIPHKCEVRSSYKYYFTSGPIVHWPFNEWSYVLLNVYRAYRWDWFIIIATIQRQESLRTDGIRGE